MRNVYFPLLQDIHIQIRAEITVIQDSRQYTGRTAEGATVCTCKGNVWTINASAKGQESLGQSSVIQQQPDLARINLEGLVAYTFFCSFVHCCKCCHARLSQFTLLNESILEEWNGYENMNFMHLCWKNETGIKDKNYVYFFCLLSFQWMWPWLDRNYWFASVYFFSWSDTTHGG